MLLEFLSAFIFKNKFIIFKNILKSKITSLEIIKQIKTILNFFTESRISKIFDESPKFVNKINNFTKNLNSSLPEIPIKVMSKIRKIYNINFSAVEGFKNLKFYDEKFKYEVIFANYFFIKRKKFKQNKAIKRKY